MRVLITGGAGWIGSHLCRLIIAEGHQIILGVRSATNLDRISNILPHVSILKLSQDRNIGHVDVCIHLAWHVKMPGYLDASENIVSLNNSLDLLQLLTTFRCERFVAVGTCLEYAASVSAISEINPVMPKNLYAVCKDAFRRVAEIEARLRKMCFTWARIFYLYGPGESTDRFVCKVLQDLIYGRVCNLSLGIQVRDFLHVEDVATAIWTVAKSSHNGVVNIGSSVPTTIKEAAYLIGDLTARSDLLRFSQPVRDESPYIVADTKLLRSLGWSPRYALRDGFAMTLAEMRREKE